MGVPFNRRTLLVRGPAATGNIAGASVLGLDLADTAGATISAAGLNGISKAKPKKGGALVLGVDAGESGFNPTTARSDEVAVMYARTVFDPTDQPCSGGHVPGPGVGPVRRRRSRPLLHFLEHHDDPVQLALGHMSRHKDPELQTALELGRTSANTGMRGKACQTVNKRPPVDRPYLWLDRAMWAVVSAPKVQSWNNPTTPTGAAAYGMIGGSIWPTQIWMS